MQRTNRITVCNLAVAICLVLLGSGCSTATLNTTKAVTMNPSQVSLMVDNSAAKGMTADELAAFKNTITQSLKKEGISAVSADSKTGPSLNAQITAWDAGIPLLRFFVGFGAGEGSLSSTWTLKNENGDVLGSCEIDGLVRWGWLGGTMDDAAARVGEQLVQFLKKK